MRTVYKYTLNYIGTPQVLNIPEHSIFLKSGVQNEVVVIWMEVDTDQPVNTTEFIIFGTGHEIEPYEDSGFAYMDSTQMPNGLVWHIYQRFFARRDEL